MKRTGAFFDHATHRAMPKLSEFYGIQIFIYGREHGVPHFHAKYQASEIVKWAAVVKHAGLAGK